MTVITDNNLKKECLIIFVLMSIIKYFQAPAQICVQKINSPDISGKSLQPPMK